MVLFIKTYKLQVWYKIKSKTYMTYMVFKNEILLFLLILITLNSFNFLMVKIKTTIVY